MKKKIILLSILILLFPLVLSSCFINNTATQGLLIDGTEQTYNQKNILRETVDTNTTQLSSNDIAISFEQGELASGTTVELFEFTTQSEEAENLITPLYKIQMDQAPSSNITVKIKLPDGYSIDNTLAGIVTPVYDSINDSISHSYEYYPITVENGYAVFTTNSFYAETVQNASNTTSILNSVSADSGNFTTIFYSYAGLFDATFEYVGGHFRVSQLFTASNTYGATLLDMLEEVYSYYENDGYTYSFRKTWPFDIYLKTFLSADGYMTASGTRTLETGESVINWENARIELKRSMFTDSAYSDDSILKMLAHEWFHFIQLQYITTAGGSSVNTEWLDEATATWQEKNLGAQGHLPDVYQKYYLEQFQGVYPKENTRSAGYARAGLIDFLQENIDGNIIKPIYEEIAKGNSIENAITNTVGDPAIWVDEYYGKLVLGELYNNSNVGPYEYYRNIRDNDKDFSSLGDFSTVTVDEAFFEDSYPETTENIVQYSFTLDPYSAYLLPFEFSDVAGITDDMKLNIAVSEGAFVQLVKHQTAKNTIIPATDNIELTSLATELMTGYHYLPIVVNHQKEAITVYYTMTISKAEPLPSIPTIYDLEGAWVGKNSEQITIYAIDEFNGYMIIDDKPEKKFTYELVENAEDAYGLLTFVENTKLPAGASMIIPDGASFLIGYEFDESGTFSAYYSIDSINLEGTATYLQEITEDKGGLEVFYDYYGWYYEINATRPIP